MRLGELIARETHTSLDAVMLLRHGNDSVADLRRHGATVEEFSAIHPVESKYDYLHPARSPISVVAVIADDRVYGIYRVMGVEAEGTPYELGSEEYKKFDHERHRDNPKRATQRCRRFALQPLPSISLGLPVRGWEGRTRTPVQRHDSKFFDEVEVGPAESEPLEELVERSFEEQVADSLRRSRLERLRRLANAPAIPPRIPVTTYVFARNADVVAEVLTRAGGVCEGCRTPAPFQRRSDGTPYLEVHHRQQLAKGGEDVVENAIALCPNCHRKAHHG